MRSCEIQKSLSFVFFTHTTNKRLSHTHHSMKQNQSNGSNPLNTEPKALISLYCTHSCHRKQAEEVCLRLNSHIRTETMYKTLFYFVFNNSGKVNVDISDQDKPKTHPARFRIIQLFQIEQNRVRVNTFFLLGPFHATLSSHFLHFCASRSSKCTFSIIY